MKKKVLTIIAIVCIAFTASAFVTGQVYYIPLQVTAGSCVITNKPIGPVSIENGKTIIKCPKGIEINGVFEIKKGTEFKVNTINSDN